MFKWARWRGMSVRAVQTGQIGRMHGTELCDAFEPLESRRMLSGELLVLPQAAPSMAGAAAPVTLHALMATPLPQVSIVKTRNASETNGMARGSGQFVVTRHGSVTDPLTVQLAVTGTAVNHQDYVITAMQQGDIAPITDRVVIPAGARSITLTVLVADDDIIEGTETLHLALVSDPTYILSPHQNQVSLTITDNDRATVSVTTGIAQASETDPQGTGKGSFVLSRNSDIGSLMVHMRMSGTAGLHSDFVLRRAGASTNLGSSITFNPGEDALVIELIPIDDTRAEPTETAILTLLNHASYLVSAGQNAATVTIADNETVGVVATIPHASETDPTHSGKGAFTLTRGSPLGVMTVNFSLAVGEGHALRGTDYVLRLAGSTSSLTTHSITMVNDVSSVTIEVIPVDDVFFEGNETVVLSLNPSTQYNIVDGQGSATLTIQDNEQEVRLIASDPTASETNPTTTGQGAFTLTRSYPVGDLTVHFAVATGDNHATRGSDYVLRRLGSITDHIGNGITFADGESSIVLDVIPVDDTIAELDETVVLALVASDEYRIHESQHTGTVTIADNEPRVSLVVTKAHASETSPTTTGIGRFSISRTGPTSSALTVQFALETGQGQAIRGTDYTIRRQGTTTAITVNTITLNAGQASVVLEVVPMDDTVAEPTETVVMSLVPTANYSVNPAQSSGAIHITDNEPIVSLLASVPIASESNPATTGKGAFTISRTGATTASLTVNFAVTLGEGQAVRGVDYLLRRAGTPTDITTDSITFNAGQASVVIEVIPIDDDLVEEDESIVLSLLPGGNYHVNANPAQATATVILQDNENISILASTPTASETNPETTGKGAFTVIRNGSPSGSVTVNFTVAAGTGQAIRGTDYHLRLAGSGETLTSNSITLANGIASVVIEVIPINDQLVESHETVVLSLSSNGEYRVHPGQGSATVTIEDNERVGITASTPNASETNPTTSGMGAFTLTRADTTGPLVVNFTIASGTGHATRHVDYHLRLAGSSSNLVSNTVTFADGDSVIVIQVIPIDDHLAEGSETVTLTLQSSRLYNPITGQQLSATVTIADNEPTVSIVATKSNASETDPENTGQGILTLTRTGNHAEPLKADFTITTGSGFATRAADYFLRRADTGLVLTGNSLMFEAGQSSVVVAVIPFDDNLAESSEIVRLNLAASRFYFTHPTQNSAAVTIADNEPTVSVVATDAIASEQGQDTGAYTITRTAPDISQPMVVTFQMGGSATRASDYVLRLSTADGPVVTGNSVTIAAGQNSVKLVLVPVDDDLTEPTESAAIILMPVPGSYVPILGSHTARIAITDNEPVVSVVKTKDASEVNPTTTGTGSFSISRTGSTRSALTVNYTVAGTATAGGDYMTLTGSVVIPAGRSSVALPVIPTVDTLIEDHETVIVTLTAHGSYRLDAARMAASLTIADAPITPPLFFGNLTFTQSFLMDDTLLQPDGSRSGLITSAGSFVSSHGRTGTYTYITPHGPGSSAHASLRLVLDGLPSLDTQAMILTWTTPRLISLHMRQMQWLSGAPGSSGSFTGHGMIQADGQLVDMNGFFVV